ncbi:MAG: hypothetical protein V2B19_22005 [Pseudomonadota bacterium]
MAIEPVGTIDYNKLPPLDSATARAMSRELKISLLLSAIYFSFLLGVTILNYAAPGVMKAVLWGGMTMTWFATSLMAMFMASFIAWLHVRYYQRRLAETTQAREVI